MLSILIPTYHYNIYNLVCELHKQCLQLGITFEIIAQDDASNSEFNLENQKINALEHCRFTTNTSNLGRGNNRNLLAQQSQYPWLLFLDCDTMPISENFIANYIKALGKADVVFGGLTYQLEPPKSDEMLRWIYGKKREALSLQERLHNPTQTALTSNLLIKKDIFLSHPFDAAITAYGYEDYLFFLNLKQHHISITPIDNAVMHLGLETSKVFLEKTKIAIKNLVSIAQKHPDLVAKNKIIKAYSTLKFLRLIGLFNFTFQLLKHQINKQLISKKPSLWLFDWYKLGCFIEAKKQFQ